jgi:hypothetical protein
VSWLRRFVDWLYPDSGPQGPAQIAVLVGLISAAMGLAVALAAL